MIALRASRQDNTRPTRILIVLAAAAVAAAPLAFAAPADEEASPECRAAVAALEARLAALGANASFAEALALVQETAGAACGFDLHARPPAPEPTQGLLSGVCPGGSGAGETVGVISTPLETLTYHDGAAGSWGFAKGVAYVEAHGPVFGVHASNSGVGTVFVAGVPLPAKNAWAKVDCAVTYVPVCTTFLWWDVCGTAEIPVSCGAQGGATLLALPLVRVSVRIVADLSTPGLDVCDGRTEAPVPGVPPPDPSV